MTNCINKANSRRTCSPVGMELEIKCNGCGNANGKSKINGVSLNRFNVELPAIKLLYPCALIKGE